jgi:hypothetical protein
MRSLSLAILVAVALLTGGWSVEAYPDRPVTWVLGFPPGGVSDSGTRMLARALGEKIGQSVIVDNRPGANGIVAAQGVAAAKPDGYTLMTASNGVMAANKFLYKKLSYDPPDSFTIVGGVATSPALAGRFGNLAVCVGSGACELREEESGETELWDDRHGKRVPPYDRDVGKECWHRGDTHSVQRINGCDS